MKKSFLIIALAALFASGCGKQSPASNVGAALPRAAATSVAGLATKVSYDRLLQVGNQALSVQIATSSTDMEEGLSDRLSMAKDEGMLFMFPRAAEPGFWMPRMHFNLDMIWIENGKIVGITPDVPAPKTANENLPLYYPPSPVDEVLEVNAGWAAANKIKTESEVRLVN